MERIDIGFAKRAGQASPYRGEIGLQKGPDEPAPTKERWFYKKGQTSSIDKEYFTSKRIYKKK